jgi:hypothetical protein
VTLTKEVFPTVHLNSGGENPRPYIPPQKEPKQLEQPKEEPRGMVTYFGADELDSLFKEQDNG